ncbi:hypothetical protein Lfu02_73160 [Longispora fulva]|uniref:HNH nuclease domain-containing protein n=1 Tax=Longispora fulva TaxID=619741 RepID=A0A8J7GLS4_9ACTN|nr:HNH endonuclease [Longispora fulva]MBG6133903.1 hypothetical protein [Longispora fulva]GIG62944.1 hypothetical protein Lfu02_73160 [Longispora fulva]
MTKSLAEFTRGHARCRACAYEDKINSQVERRADPETELTCAGACGLTLPTVKFDPGSVTCRSCLDAPKFLARAEAAARGATKQCRKCLEIRSVMEFALGSLVCWPCCEVWKTQRWAELVATESRKPCGDCEYVKPLGEFYPWDRLCRRCRLAEVSRQWHADLDGNRARRRAVYAANPEPARARSMAFSKTSAGRVVQHRSYWKRRTVLLAKGRRRYEEHGEQMRTTSKAWKDRNPDRVNWHTRKRRNRIVAAIGSHTDREWREMLRRHAGRCAYCGKQAVERDHVVPLTRGGSDFVSNLLPACRGCNCSKNNKLLVEWRYRIDADGVRRTAPILHRLARALPRHPLP